ncbi:hypothetical protein RUND412_008114 [Rhizina undulata]
MDPLSQYQKLQELLTRLEKFLQHQILDKLKDVSSKLNIDLPSLLMIYFLLIFGEIMALRCSSMVDPQEFKEISASAVSGDTITSGSLGPDRVEHGTRLPGTALENSQFPDNKDELEVDVEEILENLDFGVILDITNTARPDFDDEEEKLHEIAMEILKNMDFRPTLEIINTTSNDTNDKSDLDNSEDETLDKGELDFYYRVLRGFICLSSLENEDEEDFPSNDEDKIIEPICTKMPTIPEMEEPKEGPSRVELPPLNMDEWVTFENGIPRISVDNKGSTCWMWEMPWWKRIINPRDMLETLSKNF